MSNYPEIIQFGSDGGGLNAALPLVAMSNGGLGGGFLGGGFGGSLIGGFLGSLFPNLFGGWNGGFGGGASAGAAALGAQANANNNADLIVQAVTSQGEQSRQAIQTLSTMLGQDFNTVNSQISAISAVINQIAIQNATTPLQVINAINSGNAALASQLSQCCCENRLLTTEQGYQAQLRTVEQTNQLGSQADRNTTVLLGAIQQQTISMNDKFCELKERELQNKIDARDQTIAQLRDAAQTAQITSMIAPLQTQIAEILQRLNASGGGTGTTTPTGGK